MRNFHFIIILLFTLAGCSDKPLSLEQKLAKVDSLLTDYQAPGMPGAAVMIIRNKKVLYKKGFGLANIENNDWITPATNFRLASVTKQFTSMAVLQLIENEKISLDTNLIDIFTDFPAIGQKISIRELLRHTSGLVDYESLVPEEQEEQVRDKDVLALISQKPEVYFPVGEKYQYSNSAYALLALTVEKVSGLSFSDYLDQYIFKPLDMNNSVALVKERHTVSDRAYGYTIEEDGSITRTDQSVFSAVLGDGGVYSSLNDLQQWDQALYEHKLLGPELSSEMFKDQKNASGEPIKYGYGWRLEDLEKYKVTYHTGVSRGFRNILYRIADEQFTVVILTNRNSYAELTPLEMAREISLLILDK